MDDAYTPSQVRQALQNYPDLCAFLDVAATPFGEDSQQFDMTPRPPNPRPFGWTATGSPWPFMTKPNATPPFDGKRKAIRQQDLHVLVLDLEEGLRRLSDGDRDFLLAYYVVHGGNYPNDGTSSEMAVWKRASRLTRRLANLMNGWCHHEV